MLGNLPSSGVYKGPKVRSHAHDLTKKFHKLGLKHALSAKANKSAMIIDVEIAVQQPENVNLEELKNILPYGKGSFKTVFGGLDVEKAEGGITVIANAAVIVSFDMEESNA